MSFLACKVCNKIFGNAHIQEAFPNFVQQCPRCYPDEPIKIVLEDTEKPKDDNR